MTRVQPINLENVRIGFKNFEGKEGKFNKAGDRSFAVFLDMEVAEELARDGWNVKFPKERTGNFDPDEEDTRNPYLSVAISSRAYPSNIILVSGETPSKLEEDQFQMLDWAELENVDLVIRPYTYEVHGKAGIKAYLKTGYFTIVTDAFAHKYGM